MFFLGHLWEIVYDTRQRGIKSMTAGETEFEEGATILIVDDVPEVARMVQVLLEHSGFSTVVACSGLEALELLNHRPVDLVLLDIMMPGFDGYEVLKVMKEEERFRHLPVILLTAKDMVRDKVEGLKLGADDYITKPFNNEELLARIRVQLRIQQIRRKLTQEAITDELTSLYNHRHFYRVLQGEVNRATRYRRHLSLIMLDIDRFKHYNDQWGHLAGDEALRELAEVLRKNARDVDVVARYGGEEFTIILPETPLEQAGIQAERIRSAVERYPFQGRLTVSLGVATLAEGIEKAEELVQEADRALYRAKAEGRNRVCLAE